MIHPTAIVSPGARLGRDCHVGPYAVIGGGVTLGDGVRVGNRVQKMHGEAHVDGQLAAEADIMSVVADRGGVK